MAERPILFLFNTEMVRAIQAGRKTQTRRIIRGYPLYHPYFEEDEGRGWLEESESGTFYALEAFSKIQPGDVLWVRETWNEIITGNEKLGYHKSYWYRADEKDENPDDKWRPPIHMPREAARLFLRVKDVRAERLQSITPIEIMAEGLDVLGMTKNAAFKAWIDIWNGTIKSEDDLNRYGWEANPWVWVYEFEKIEEARPWRH